ncbi:MAG: glycosyltransferase family 2 protein [Chloroflexota bacterium]|nr:glycosyltransferase family 2 protein [Chloroflexota bacterium]MDE2908603.1 glycosyltransferase family 2 protein [Chloroflexota bacterium]
MGVPKVSVILTSYNNGKYLGAAIDSILTQEFDDFELILVDDASRDDSAQIIKAYEARDSRVRTVFLDCTQGMAGARNRGFDIAQSEYIAYMDSDDVSLPARLKKQVDFLENNPEIGAVGVMVRKTRHDLALGAVRERPPQHAEIIFNVYTGQLRHISCGTLMIRRQFLDAIGGWNEAVRHEIEPGFLATLVSCASVRLANIQEVLHLQRVHSNNTSNLPIGVQRRESLAGARVLLERLLGGVSDETLRCFRSLRQFENLNWRDRRMAKRQMKRIIESLIARGDIRTEERVQLTALMNRRLENASPRRWQQFCYWRRKWFRTQA